MQINGCCLRTFKARRLGRTTRLPITAVHPQPLQRPHQTILDHTRAQDHTGPQDQLNCRHYFSDSSHCDGGPASLMFGGDGSEYGEEEEEDYQYHNWGVDRVDLDFKSGQ